MHKELKKALIFFMCIVKEVEVLYLNDAVHIIQTRS